MIIRLLLFLFLAGRYYDASSPFTPSLFRSVERGDPFLPPPCGPGQIGHPSPPPIATPPPQAGSSGPLPSYFLHQGLLGPLDFLGRQRIEYFFSSRKIKRKGIRGHTSNGLPPPSPFSLRSNRPLLFLEYNYNKTVPFSPGAT